MDGSRRPAAAPEVVTIHVAKTHLSRLVARAEAGEEIVLARGGTPVAKIVPLAPPSAPPEPPPRPRRVFGRLKGLGHVGLEAMEPLSEEEIGSWHSASPFPDPAKGT